MPKLIFYRQKRYDQAIRTGVELDGETIAERYEEGGSEPDPGLLWYVDLRCEGSAIPDGFDEAAHWLLDHSEDRGIPLQAGRTSGNPPGS